MAIEKDLEMELTQKHQKLGSLKLNIAKEKSKMSIELKESNTVSKTTLDIIIDGSKIGTVTKSKPGNSSWHAVINVPGAPFLYDLAQGHGVMPTEAINNAFEQSLADAQQYITALTALQNKVMETKEC